MHVIFEKFLKKIYAEEVKGGFRMNKFTKSKKIVGLLLVGILVSLIAIPSYADNNGEGNEYPIVLVNGFAGWGREELLGYRYWGGLVDLEEKLNDNGYETYTATVGPYSSNWDRACELYAYIKGGTVDYGEAHSKRHGHERYGRDFDGVYPEWGELDTEGKINKIHLLSHSMGAQTARMIVQLLEEGSEEERNATSEGLGPLFEGNKSIVHSVTTISGTHDGTTLADGFNMLNDFAKNGISFFAAIAGCDDDPIYDFKLDQWGLQRKEGESFLDYSTRVFNSSIWDESNKDFSVWDLSTDGASIINGWVEAQPDVYYFSYATSATIEKKSVHVPVPGVVNPFLFPYSIFVGSYTRDEPNRPVIDSSWLENDGVVNTISQNGPKTNSSDIIVEYNGDPQIGKWNYMGKIELTDHLDIVGTIGNIVPFYLEIAEDLVSLPE
jgi:triacylglycerol lipase